VANLLHVTPRTLHNWNSGRYDIPYAAFKLLRVLMRYELPHDDWAGWHFSGGKLWTPEGYSIAPHESSWWSLLVRRAQMFSSMYARCNQLEAQLRDGRAAQQPGPDSFLEHFPTGAYENSGFHRETAPQKMACTWSVATNCMSAPIDADPT
jgi:hypothetical protein